MEEPTASNTKQPLVTVVVPVYNAGKFLGEALESLRSQSYARFEAIMVDDGSTDESAEICERFCKSDRRFRLIRQPNCGVSAARNAGIENAKGDWIAFLDADDMMYPESLRHMLDTALLTGAPIVAAGYDAGITPGGTQRFGFRKGKTVVLAAAEAICIGLYQKRILNNPWGMLFRAELFQADCTLRFRPGRYEDLDFFYRAFERAGRIALSDETVYFYRENPDSFINTWSASRLDALDVTDRIVAHYRAKAESQPGENTARLLRAALDRRFSAHFNLLQLMLSLDEPPPGQIQRCLRVIRIERRRELADPRVRLKNKLGALASYGGLPFLRLLGNLTR
ncbi:MAG: glycosyltransferase [Muribaculaceae bacterium]|nr:glycosyltransferase [Muribaculaceae bacterium]